MSEAHTQNELLRALDGLRPFDAGTMSVDDCRSLVAVVRGRGLPSPARAYAVSLLGAPGVAQCEVDVRSIVLGLALDDSEDPQIRTAAIELSNRWLSDPEFQQLLVRMLAAPEHDLRYAAILTIRDACEGLDEYELDDEEFRRFALRLQPVLDELGTFTTKPSYSDYPIDVLARDTAAAVVRRLQRQDGGPVDPVIDVQRLIHVLHDLEHGLNRLMSGRELRLGLAGGEDVFFAIDGDIHGVIADVQHGTMYELAHQLVSAIQDHICEELQSPWPFWQRPGEPIPGVHVRETPNGIVVSFGVGEQALMITCTYS